MWAIPSIIKPTASEQQLVKTEVRKSITKLGHGIELLEIKVAEISGEWQGVKHIPDIKSKTWTVEQQYAELQQDTEGAPVILYLHGGGYVLASPDTHRIMTLNLAKGCGGRVFSLRYRLAPQNPFPAALVDAVLAYKYLIDPPEGALHRPVDPSKIIIAGDSAGVYSSVENVLTGIGWINVCFDDGFSSFGSCVCFTCRGNWDFTMVGPHLFICFSKG